MTALRRLLLRLWNVVSTRAAEGELEREMASHLALLEEGRQPALLMLSLLACYLPARRATRLDPVAALRPQ